MTGNGDTQPGRSSGRGLHRAPVVAAVVAVLALAVAIDVTADDGGSARSVPAAEAGPTVPGADALSVSWYCPEGTATADGRADGTVLVANMGDDDAEALVSVMAPGEGAPVVEHLEVPARGQVAVDLVDVAAAEETIEAEGTLTGPAVVVEVFGGRAVVEHAVERGGDVAVGPCARQPSRDWYFAAGTTVRGVEHVITLLNPFGEDAVVDLSFVTEEGFEAPAGAQGLVVPRRSRIAVLVHDQVRRRNQVAVHAHARAGRVVAEQSLVSDGSEVPAGVALSLGSPSLGRRWVAPFGQRLDGDTEMLSVANFGDVGTEVEVTTVTDEDPGGPPVETVAVAGRSVVSVDIARNLSPDTEFATEVTTTENVPVVVEELAGWTAPAAPPGIATDVALAASARTWVFAGPDVDEADAVIAVSNATDDPITVELLAYSAGALDASGSAADRVVDPGQHATFRLSELGVDLDQVVLVQGDGEFFAERQIETPTGRSIDAGIRDLER